MTIPDIGHCAGSGAAPIDGTTKPGDPSTAVCPACSGRVELRADGALALHESTPLEERETVEQTQD